MEKAQSERLLIVDGHAYAYRAFHAIRRLEGPGGQPTNAIFGFVKMVEKMRTTLAPSHLVVVWDGGLSPERTVELPDYKAQRPPMPESLGAQIDQMQEYLAAAGLASLCQDDVEADDWIGSIARSASLTMPVVIASSDKDFMQLVSPRVGLLNPNDKTERVWTAEDVFTKAGVRPEQIVDWLSLIGDAVDNIPGVNGVGPKTAAELLQQFGTIDGVLAGIEQVKSERLREALRSSSDRLLRNRRLIGLLPVSTPVDLAALRIGDPNVTILRVLFERWGFRGLRAALEEQAPAVQQALF